MKKTNNRNTNNYAKKNSRVDSYRKKTHSIVKPTSIRAGGMLEYKMPVETYNEYVRAAKKANVGDIQAYLCKIVNEQYGLLGTCVRVISF